MSTRQSHPLVFARPGGKPLSRPYPVVSYTDATSLKTAVALAARHYFPALRSVAVDLAGPWRQCRGRAYIVAPSHPPVDLEFHPATARPQAPEATQEGLLP